MNRSTQKWLGLVWICLLVAGACDNVDETEGRRDPSAEGEKAEVTPTSDSHEPEKTKQDEHGPGPLLLPPLPPTDSERQLIEGLIGRLSDPATRDATIRELGKPRYNRRLPTFSAPLLAALGEDRSPPAAVVLAALPITATLAASLRSLPGTPDSVKAKLGDLEAWDRVLREFKEADRVATSLQRTRDLVYVGTPTACKAFGAALQSKKVYRDVHGNRVSLLHVLLKTYGEFHPELKLFSLEELLSHANVSGEAFRSAPHQDFLRKVESHFKEKHNLVVTLDPPLLIETLSQGEFPERIK